MASTKDKELGAGCVRDVKNVRKVFKKIAAHGGFTYCEIEISGDNYNGQNLRAVIKVLDPMEIDVTIFYYSGHGFTYSDDNSRQFPQLDMRHPATVPEYNDINFIRKNTKNLHEVLQLIRLRGGRINIVIGDCCSTLINHKRSKKSKFDLEVVEDIMAPEEKALSKKVFNSTKKYIDIVVSAAQIGQAAVTDLKHGSIFTQNFTEALAAAIIKEPRGEKYLPWHRLLKNSAVLANKEAQEYDAGEGKPGQQMAIFQIFGEEVNF
ncbi:MAG TPA: caspase family protein [Ferruginibacter sp.]|nr:caspase family protein [Ferruginibacter sp.]